MNFSLYFTLFVLHRKKLIRIKNNIVPAGQRELDLAVVHLGDKGPPALAGGHGLAPDDLDGVGPGSVPGSHVSVALGDGTVDGEVTVLSVHVVGA